MAMFKASGWTRRLENCNYPDGREVNGRKDSPGIDCNWVKDTSPIQPFFGLPTYWTLMLRPAHAGWDSAATNAEDGPDSTTIEQHMRRIPCTGNPFCTDGYATSRADLYSGFGPLQSGYEPNLGILVDIALTVAVSWKWTMDGMHEDLPRSHLMPILWTTTYLHLPGAILMELSKLQVIPAALNGFWIFLITQCMVSLIGGVACCFCGA
jgi:hypothetical protein